MASFMWPTTGFISSPYGLRNGKLHAGIDIAAPEGTPIKASRAGVVKRASWFNGYGNCIDIDHGGGYATRYGHLSKIEVNVGRNVDAGDVIARMGHTGDATGPHLHFEIHVSGKPVNPQPYLSGKLSASNVSDTLISLPNPIEDLTQLFGAYSNIAGFLLNPHNWARIAMMVSGIILIGLALLSTRAVRSTVKSTVKAVV